MDVIKVLQDAEKRTMQDRSELLQIPLVSDPDHSLTPHTQDTRTNTHNDTAEARIWASKVLADRRKLDALLVDEQFAGRVSFQGFPTGDDTLSSMKGMS